LSGLRWMGFVKYPLRAQYHNPIGWRQQGIPGYSVPHVMARPHARLSPPAPFRSSGRRADGRRVQRGSGRGASECGLIRHLSALTVVTQVQDS
jgi:hypothetical protein